MIKLAVYSVGQVTQYIKSIFEAAKPLARISIRGEIANFKRQSSGHLYFSIKDANSQLKAIMFATNASRLDFRPSDGMRVIIDCNITVYEKGGVYQAYVSSMQPDGIGALYLAYEKLKEQLQQEGLFDVTHKKSLPHIPGSIGVITSPTGAAVRDIINITGRRWPQAKLYIYPAKVQGDGAEQDLINGLRYFECKQKVDVIIIGRGGGSIEDLWAFNSERLAREIYSVGTPIISAVGHETDFTICDWVADMRAPTPSAAAELVVPDVAEMRDKVGAFKRLAKQKIEACLKQKQHEYSIVEQKLKSNMLRFFENKRHIFDNLSNAINVNFDKYLADKRHLLTIVAARLQAINPLSVLSRGYSIVEKDGKSVCDIRLLNVGDSIVVRMKNGKVNSTIQNIVEEKIYG